MAYRPMIRVTKQGFAFGIGAIVSLDYFVGVSIMFARWCIDAGFRNAEASPYIEDHANRK